MELKVKQKDKHASQKRYNETKTKMISMRLCFSTDSDILDHLQGKATQTEIKRLIRKALKIEAEEAKNAPEPGPWKLK